MSYKNSKVINGISISKQLIDKNYTKGIFIVPKYIIIHDTNNKDFGANAKFNRDFISVNSRVKASAHYIVDDKSIIQLLEDTYRGWHVGDNPNKVITNSNSLAIELCINRDNSFAKTINNALGLVQNLMKKYNIAVDDVKRHYDVTGKNCPVIMMVDNPAIWPCFKSALKNDENEVNIIKPIAKGKIMKILTSLNVKEAQDRESESIGSIKSEEEFFIYEETNNWYKIIYNIDGDTIFGYVAKNYVEIIDMKESKRKIKEYISKEIAIKEVQEVREYIERTSRVNNVYKEIDTKESKAEKVELVRQTQTVPVSQINKQIIEKKNSINKSPVQRRGKISGAQVNLAVRKGPGYNFYAIAYLLENEEIIVLEKVNDWYKIVYNSSRGQKEGYVEEQFIELH